MTIKRLLPPSLVIAIMVAASASGRLHARIDDPAVTITDLGALDGATHGAAIDINNDGLVVGYSGDFPNYCCGFIPPQPHGFLWNPATGVMHDLGVWMGAYGGGINSSGHAISDGGLIAGSTRAAYFDNVHYLFTSEASDVLSRPAWQPFVSSTWTMTIWGVLGGQVTTPEDANANRVIVGVSTEQAFVWDETAGMSALPTLRPGPSAAKGINDAGVIVGYGDVSIPVLARHPLRWDAVTRAVEDLGLPAGWQQARAEGINASGTVIGYGVDGASRTRAFVWTQAAGFSTLGTLGGLHAWAQDINAAGRVVGYSTTATGETHAFAWDPATDLMVDLGRLAGDQNSYAYAINDQDQVVGKSVGGVERPVLWTVAFVPPDAEAPAVNCETPDGLWHALNVSLACTAQDGGSGLADASDASFALTTSVGVAVETATAATGTRTVCDAAGNCATAGPIGDNKIDRQAPTIAVTSPTTTNYLVGQVVNAAFSCADGGSGVGTCVGSAADGAPIHTATVGSHTFTVLAEDAVGNSAATNRPYGVAYNHCVLFDQTKAHKSGSTIPVKLALCDAAGANVSAASVAVVATGIYLVSTNAPGPLEDSGNANPDHQFRFAGDSYIFNLSLKGFMEGTYAITFTASGDPTTHSVQFQVR